MLFKKRCSIINFPLFWRKCCQRQKIHRCERDTALLVVFHHLSPISFAVVHSFSVVGFDKWSCPNPGNIICSHEIKADDSHHLQYPPLVLVDVIDTFMEYKNMRQKLGDRWPWWRRREYYVVLNNVSRARNNFGDSWIENPVPLLREGNEYLVIYVAHFWN